MKNISRHEHLQILVVEDSPSHIKDIKVEMNRRISQGAHLNVLYVSNLHDALRQMNSADGIISDVFFPLNLSGINPDANAQSFLQRFARDNVLPASGTYLAHIAHKNNLPIALCTDGHHHAKNLREVYSFIQEEGIPFVPNYQSEYESVAKHKYWASAYGQMLDLIGRKVSGFPQVFENIWSHEERYKPSREEKEKYNCFIKQYTLPEDFNPRQSEPER